MSIEWNHGPSRFPANTAWNRGYRSYGTPPPRRKHANTSSSTAPSIGMYCGEAPPGFPAPAARVRDASVFGGQLVEPALGVNRRRCRP